MSNPVPLSLDHTVIPLPQATPGTEILIHGSVYSTFDGSTLDAATTSWPDGAPGGASIQAGGLIDLGPGTGLHLVSRDVTTHDVRLLVTGDPAPTCAAMGVAGPCLVMRQRELATARLQPASDWMRSLRGSLTMDVHLVAPPFVPTPSNEIKSFLGVGLVALVFTAFALIAWKLRRRRTSSPLGQLLALAERVRDRARKADPLVAAPLMPAIEAAWIALKAGRVDPGSTEGLRIATVLAQVDVRLNTLQSQIRSDAEKAVVESMIADFDAALSASEEVHGMMGKTR